MNTETPALARMETLLAGWEQSSDPKAVFLKCYWMMTRNMLAGAARGEFLDADWVQRLIEHFAEYYFAALEAYESAPASAPAVWQLAFGAAQRQHPNALQLLLLGVNAHINYDLVLAAADVLQAEWPGISQRRRAARYRDYNKVNDVIARTVDSVQDEVLEVSLPAMDVIDKLLGPVDEALISRLLSGWRETVWRNATRLLDSRDEAEKQQLIQEVETEALRIGRWID